MFEILNNISKWIGHIIEMCQELMPTSFLMWLTYSILFILALLGLIKVLFGIKMPIIDNFKITQDKIVDIGDEYHHLGEKMGLTIQDILYQIKYRIVSYRTTKRAKKIKKIRKGKVSNMNILKTKSWQQIVISVVLLIIAIAVCILTVIGATVEIFGHAYTMNGIVGGCMTFITLTGLAGTVLGEKLEKALNLGTSLGVNLQEQLCNASQVKELSGYVTANEKLLVEIVEKKTAYENKAKICTLSASEVSAYETLCAEEVAILAQNVELNAKIDALKGVIVSEIATSVTTVVEDVKDLVE